MKNMYTNYYRIYW